MMLKPIVPKDRCELEKQIAALEYQLSIETNEKDRKIFEETLQMFKEATGGACNG